MCVVVVVDFSKACGVVAWIHDHSALLLRPPGRWVIAFSLLPPSPSPPDDKLSREEWKQTEASFKGDIPRGRKPFRNDGYGVKPGGAKPAAKTAVKAKAAAVAVEETERAEDTGFLAYLRQAAQRVVGNNFTSDETEPEWTNTGSGYTGKRPKRDR